jgi:transcriptional regulator with XRE-family HTH domain
MKLNNHFTPVWEIVENFRHFLNLKDKTLYTDNQIAEKLKMSRKTLAAYKNSNSALIMAHLSLYCIEHKIDVSSFIKFKNSVTVSLK